MKKFNEILTEGLYDPGIFKAFFLAGGPASGKSFVTKSLFSGTGIKLVNSDNFFERALKKVGLSLNMPEEEAYFRDMIRTAAKQSAANQLDLYVKSRLGLVIDATGRDYDIIARQYAHLHALGYDCYMIFVNTSLDVALQRQRGRERQVPEFILTKSWRGVQDNIGKFQRLFGMNNFLIVDNNKSEEELTTVVLAKAYRIVKRLMSAPVKSYIAKRWMAKERKEKRR